MKRKPTINLRLSSIILHLLIPGMGHIFLKEFLFGIFVFLVMMVASVLFVAALFMEIPVIAEIGLYGLPILYYAFAVLDLLKTVEKIKHDDIRRKSVSRSAKRFFIYAAIGLIIQIVWPLAPINFAIYNAPQVFTMKYNDFAPQFKRGDLLKASSLVWRVRVSVLDKPILYKIPNRYDLVRFTDQSNKKHCGYVIGLPAEDIEVVDGTVIANNVPLLGIADGRITLPGNLKLTRVADYNVLIATLRMGAIDSTYHVPLGSLIGKVDHLF